MSRNYDLARSILTLMVVIGGLAVVGGLMLAIRALLDDGFLAMVVVTPPLLAGCATMAAGLVGIAILDIAENTQFQNNVLHEIRQRLAGPGDRR